MPELLLIRPDTPQRHHHPPPLPRRIDVDHDDNVDMTHQNSPPRDHHHFNTVAANGHDNDS
jgi:hypothetical protein